jgi:hypothetical protein
MRCRACFFCALAAGPILNLRYGPRPAHYALTMLAALGGASVSVRQILLHILPGDPGYGSAILGLHYYTWAFVLFVAALIAATVMLMFEQQFEPGRPQRGDAPKLAATRPALSGLVAIWLVIALSAANAASTFAICGPMQCPDNPLRYELFHLR